MSIPFVDLKAQYLSLKSELDEAVSRVMGETAYISGRYAAEFENSFAEYLGVAHCVAVANGTDAIEIGLQAIGIETGDEVIVPANTFIATAEGVSNIGAAPVFVDNDPQTYNIDTTKIEEKITEKTRAIIAVHLYGQPAEMDEILRIAREHNLKVVEDTAQAHGATYKGKKVGTFGDVATFSFYPSKNLGAAGDAGAIVTNDEQTAVRARLIANHGQASKNRHTMPGRNSRMDGIQAAVLSTKLPHLEGWLESRRENAKIYDELLADTDIATPMTNDDVRHIYHLYVVRVRNRDAVQARLAEKCIETGIHYPIAVPLMEAYSSLDYSAADFPVASSQMHEILSLPMYAELTGGQIEEVCRELKSAVPQGAAAGS